MASGLQAQGKITALAVSLVVAAEIREGLQQALLLTRSGDESQERWVIAKEPPRHIA
jgi:hypothetical protein